MKTLQLDLELFDTVSIDFKPEHWLVGTSAN